MPRWQYILTNQSNGIFTITMNRPDKRNALCPQLMEELTAALNEAEVSDAGVVILTGTGPAFCAGLDMEHLSTQHLHAHTPEEY